MAIKNILVTGGTGRLGGFVCAHLKECGYNAAAFDVAPPKAESVNVKLGIPFVQGNLTNLNDLLRAYTFAQADAVVHLGAITHNVDLQPPFPNPGRAWQKKSGGRGWRFQEMAEDATMNINTMGSFYVLDAARRLGIKTVVMAASYFVLGIGFRLSGTSFKPDYLPMASAPEAKYMSQAELKTTIEKNKKLMKEAAKKMEFLDAARYRDEIVRLEDLLKESVNG